jgi:3-oxoacyl-[acyl-carrier-protein] synthase III
MSKYVPPQLRDKASQSGPKETKQMLKQLKSCAEGNLMNYNINLDDIDVFQCIQPNNWVQSDPIGKGNAGQVYQACCQNNCSQSSDWL